MKLLDPSILSNLSSYVAINAHGEALQFAAEALGFNDLANKLCAINCRQNELGYLSIDLKHQRRALRDTLLAQASKELSDSGYRALVRYL